MRCPVLSVQCPVLGVRCLVLSLGRAVRGAALRGEMSLPSPAQTALSPSQENSVLCPNRPLFHSRTPYHTQTSTLRRILQRRTITPRVEKNRKRKRKRKRTRKRKRKRRTLLGVAVALGEVKEGAEEGRVERVHQVVQLHWPRQRCTPTRVENRKLEC